MQPAKGFQFDAFLKKTSDTVADDMSLLVSWVFARFKVTPRELLRRWTAGINQTAETLCESVQHTINKKYLICQLNYPSHGPANHQPIKQAH
jgi:hypothetical protein